MRQVLEIEAGELLEMIKELPTLGKFFDNLDNPDNLLINESDTTWDFTNGHQTIIISSRKTMPGDEDSTHIYQSLTYRIAIGAKQYDISYTAYDSDYETYLELFMAALESFRP